MTLPPKNASELRVFAFGGSTVAGVPVPEIGFVAQMQYWLRRLSPDRDIRVYNFGWAGVDTLFVLQEVTRRLNDGPDLIIVITGHNEYLGPVGRTARIREILSHFATVRVAQHYRARLKKSSRSHAMPSQVEPWNREAATFRSGMASFEEYMKLIVQRSRQRGVTLIVGTGCGYILNVLSTAAFRSTAGVSLYAASKFGARALTEALVAENTNSGIRITSVSPGPVNTTIWDHKLKPPSREERALMLQPSDIAEIFAWLLDRPSRLHIPDITVTPWTGAG